MSDTVDLARALTELRAKTPLVQCLTNIVVANWTANVLLAAGAAPAMVDNAAEASMFAGIAGGVLINTGTPYAETAEAMREAVRGAAKSGTPWVLDPVAFGLSFRSEIARDVLALGRPAIIRGNASEIMGLAGVEASGRGVDAGDPVEAALAAARELAGKHGCVVAVSGPVDHITDGRRTVTVANGHDWMTKVTGVGCSLGALMAAFAAVAEPLDAAVAATALLCVAADRAADGPPGPGSFAEALIDHLFLLTPDELAASARLGHA